MHLIGPLAALQFTVGTPETHLQRGAIPDYALTYAPHTVLYSGEGWWPSDVATHLDHVTPEVDFTPVTTESVTLDTLTSVSARAFLSSDDDVEDNPAWLLSTDNTPNSSGLSRAPATIIAADKGDYVDVFYFYFYSYNYGPLFLGERYGNHVGDWEHSMVRFVDGKPTHVYLSSHNSGFAYTYDAIQKQGARPVVYVATGTHANYATAGAHNIISVAGTLVQDHTDDGPFWDVAQNYRGYWYNPDGTIDAAGGSGRGGSEQTSESVDWLYWTGRWGDDQLPKDDPRQYCLLDFECHHVAGPTGPVRKNLGRKAVCQYEADCKILDSIWS
ncbi:hypothetical protein BD626DRAFT_473774 [Schizophyllum amplum]|uniref:Vacuolar protein sorting-associated protein 62 n=1 Tax=Schizophyllum amplum TaxID=97359 RepID=A0A550CX33_9AGAR|nr:hypothetical protein BD626DRAFT_473774 [Auriculariopsis ampla]